MYLKEIFTYLLYPALIAGTLLIIIGVLKRYEKEVGSITDGKGENQ